MKAVYFPKFHGPARNLWLTKEIRIAIGIENAINAEIPPMENNAPIATSPANMRSVDRIPKTQLNHTAFTGVWVQGLIFFQMLEKGKQSSRE